jgi:hypothetical protein
MALASTATLISWFSWNEIGEEIGAGKQRAWQIGNGL